MATYSVARAKTATLSGTTVDTVTLTGGHDKVEVKNFDTTNNLPFVHASGSTPTSPTAEVDDSVVLGPGEWTEVRANASLGNTVVKLIGNGNKYQVRGVG